MATQRTPRSQILYAEEVFKIVGAAMEVHKNLGCGFLEAVYQEALEIELSSLQIDYLAQVELPVCYKGVPLKKRYVADFLVFGKVIVEIKALGHLSSVEQSQIINYLKATHQEVGLLINFGGKSLEWKRFVRTDSSTSSTQKFAKIREIRG